jgi:adenylate kinase
MMRIVLVGPPGCGKGTQAVLIRDRYNIPQISTGDILRAAIREGTELGRKAKGYMDEGMLVPDGVIIGLADERLRAGDCGNGYVLDGFPRTIGQAKALDEMLESAGQLLDAVISIDVTDDDVVKRLSGRRQCSKCGEGYHVEFKKSRSVGICDKCGSATYLRDDDREETVRARLLVYREQTAPLLNHYGKKGLLRPVDGRGGINDIFMKICSLIGNMAP